ncbi:chromosome segregation protein SMC [Shewanella sp. JM162201]|uniref:Chromosome partition protein Smc n=1 Tax=Shewanella jiangmenensis TaxID=2837387 RepID=A0ABS5V7D7_9GAMM|nr:chromosome segregation protein SMC [Shewanella jiangmenensis]MBT1445757.1 chromosome segregation protein SMC [Shewanella jiangmenensis]
MRLKQIKLAGFKSFVDPTKIPFPNPLTAIIGPNGCGKSNVIDAVRWVLGESSAKHLRGDSMTDVIFNGSSARRPVSVASVELVFDNREGRLGGQYASYEEIAVKRQVSRDGESNYFLNGQKCRRKDITDLFMGTGLGARSYAIIEQGMISRLIESKPQELRVFIEEAAGISRYKERRRDTENRIRHTRENLERLGAIRLELGKQLEKLAIQAEAAKRYREYKQAERSTHAELLVMRYQDICDEADSLTSEVEQQTFLYEGAKAALSTIDARLSEQKLALGALTDSEGVTLESYYQAGTEVARLEQQLSHLEEHNRGLSLRVDAIKLELSTLETERLALSEAKDGATEALEEANEALLALEETHEAWQLSAEEASDNLDSLRAALTHAERASSDAKRAKDMAAQQQEHLRRALIEREQSLDSYHRQLSALPQANTNNSAESGAAFSNAQPSFNSEIDALTDALTAARTKETLAREQRNALSQRLDSDKRRESELNGRLSVLEGLLSRAAAHFSDSDGDGNSDGNGGSHGVVPLWRTLKVEAGFEAVVSQFLGSLMEQPVLGGADSSVFASSVFDSSAFDSNVIDSNATEQSDAIRPGFVRIDAAQAGASFLSAAQNNPNQHIPQGFSKVSAPVNLLPWLGRVEYADTLDEAKAKLATLAADGIILVQTGQLLGHGFMLERIDNSQDKLAQRAEADALKDELAALVAAILQLEDELKRSSQSLDDASAERRSAEAKLADAKQEASRAQARWEAEQASLLQLARQREFIEAEIQRLDAQQQEARLSLEAGDEALFVHEDAAERAQAALELAQSKLAGASSLAQERRASLSNLEKSLAAKRAQCHELGTKRALLCQQLDAADAGLGKLRAQQTLLNEELAKASKLGGEADREQLAAKLREQVALQQQRQTALAENRAAQAEVQSQIDALLLKQKQEVGKIEHLTRTLESLKLRREGLKGQAESQLSLLAEADIRLSDVAPTLPAHASVDEWQAKLEKLKSKISRLGAINLAAIEEYDEAKSRKDYLDEQDNDLNQALESLEEAIRRIDRETRSRFKATFEQVNADLGMLFPKVFGGGSAYLALTDDDLLETGVTIMARPPGKKNSTIHLLSGGEKALTALSLVFAIFRLNPAPFCMLDEVDAPLDDANVDRFCRLLQEMSASVQFIYISHNKITMEMADQLVGVTMHEPGVSRIVAVDIEEAVAMAQAE